MLNNSRTDPHHLVSTSLAAPPKKTQAADVFVFEHGGFEISIISDGFISIPEETFTPGIERLESMRALRSLLSNGDAVHASTNIPVVRSEGEIIIFDVGGGQRYQPTDGRFVDGLSSIGIDRDEVTKVVFTHAHPDHTAGTLTCQESLVFPNATYFVGESEWNYWMDPDFFSKAPEVIHEYGRSARRDLDAIRDRLVILRPGDDVIGGITAIDMAGHTPGHLCFEIEGGEGLIIAADTAISEVLSFAHPDWHFGYDSIPELAVKSRRRLLDRASAEKTKILGFHWKYPGIGFAEVKHSSYRYVPAV